MISKRDSPNHLLTPKSNKTFLRKTRQTQFNDSMTGVHPSRTHGFGIWGNRRVTWTIRIDEGLKKAAKPIIDQVFGSVCRCFESYVAGLVATYEQQGISGVHPSNTVEIGTLKIERNLRSRRKLVVEEETKVTIGCSWCHKTAVAVVVNKGTGRQAYACEYHRNFLKSQPSRVVKGVP